MHSKLQIHLFNYGATKANTDLLAANNLTIGIVKLLALPLQRWHETNTVNEVAITASHQLDYRANVMEHTLVTGCAISISFNKAQWDIFKAFFSADMYSPEIAITSLHMQLNGYQESMIKKELAKKVIF